MTTTMTHTSEPYGDSLLHYWEMRGPRGAVSLSAVEMASPSHHETLAAAGRISPSATQLFAGRFVFDVAQTHGNGPRGLGCSRHGDGCDMDAFASSVALPAWQRAIAGGLTDEAVFEQLQPLYVVEYGEVTS